MISRRHFSIAAILACAGCGARTEAQNTPAQAAPLTLAAARAGFRTTVKYDSSFGIVMPPAPKNIFSTVSYTSPVGELGAYLTPDPKDGKRHPAIIWLSGSESNTIDEMWTPRDRGNDQSAAAYRKAGIIMMLPSLRGGNKNPGKIEAMYGEVDDILAAADYLSALPYVDPKRIFLGGHSTGGTLVALTAEVKGARFRAVIASGAVEDVALYPPQIMPVDFTKLPREERVLRAPIAWLPSVECHLFMVEGDGGNIESLRAMRKVNTNPNVTFVEVPNATHFTVLAPLNEVMARKILADSGEGPVFSLSAEEITAQMAKG